VTVAAAVDSAGGDGCGSGGLGGDESTGGRRGKRVVAPTGVDAARAPELLIGRDEQPLSDYSAAAEGLYGGWWALFPLRQGFQRGAPLSDRDLKRLALFYDVRFAQSMSLLFHLANVRMRHDVNKSVASRVHSSPAAFEEYSKVIHDPEFPKKLAAAQANPKSPEATELLTRLVNFITLSASKMRWSSRRQRRRRVVEDHVVRMPT